MDINRILEIKIVEGLEESVRTQSWLEGICRGVEQLSRAILQKSSKEIINRNDFYPTINMSPLQQPQIQILNKQTTVINNLPQLITNVYNNNQIPDIINNWTLFPNINNQFKPQHIINNNITPIQDHLKAQIQQQRQVQIVSIFLKKVLNELVTNIRQYVQQKYGFKNQQIRNFEIDSGLAKLTLLDGCQLELDVSHVGQIKVKRQFGPIMELFIKRFGGLKKL